MSNMLNDQGREYTTRWPHVIAHKCGISVQYVAGAYQTVTGEKMDQFAFFASEKTGEPVAEIAALTPEQAKGIVAEMRAIRARIDANRLTNCHYCGLPLRGGECDECGSQSVGEMLGL